MTEFLCQIKQTPDLQKLFEAIQKDSNITTEQASPMETNWMPKIEINLYKQIEFLNLKNFSIF